MKRDLDLIRKILLTVENSKQRYAIDRLETLCTLLNIEDKQLVCYHVDLLLDAGFIKGTITKLMNNSYSSCFIERLTNSGYNYLDSVRNDSIWKAVKDKLANFGGTATLAVVQDLAVSLIRSQLGI